MLTLTDCPACGQELQVPTDLLGHRVKCPECEKYFHAPRYVAELPPAPPVARPVPVRHSSFCCPFCHSHERPVRRGRVSLAGWIVFAVLLVCFFPLCWLGLLIRDRYHVCYDCGIKLG